METPGVGPEPGWLAVHAPPESARPFAGRSAPACHQQVANTPPNTDAATDAMRHLITYFRDFWHKIPAGTGPPAARRDPSRRRQTRRSANLLSYKFTYAQDQVKGHSHPNHGQHIKRQSEIHPPNCHYNKSYKAYNFKVLKTKVGTTIEIKIAGQTKNVHSKHLFLHPPATRSGSVTTVTETIPNSLPQSPSRREE